MDTTTIIEQVKIRTRQYEVDESGAVIFTDMDENVFIEQLANEAIEEIKSRRQYPPYFTEEQIDDDLEKFASVVVKLVLYDVAKEGIEFESQNSENGYIRTYQSRENILRDVYPLVTVLY